MTAMARQFPGTRPVVCTEHLDPPHSRRDRGRHGAHARQHGVPEDARAPTLRIRDLPGPSGSADEATGKDLETPSPEPPGGP